MNKTLPSSSYLYPCQFSWYSPLIAIGYSRYNEARGFQELESLFDAQWDSGMLPSIILDYSLFGHYYPDWYFWQSITINNTKYQTSGIAAPPVQGLAANMLWKNCQDKQNGKQFLSRIYPKLKKWHDFLYQQRDPEKDYLVYIRHPWESGFQNSPFWQDILDDIPFNMYDIEHYERVDITHVPAEELLYQPSNYTLDRYIWLATCHRNQSYSESQIQKKCPHFMVEDVLFNTLLALSDLALSEIAGVLELGESEINYFKDLYIRTSAAIDKKLFDNSLNIYVNFNLKKNGTIQQKSFIGLTPIWLENTYKHDFNIIDTLKQDFCLDAANNREKYTEQKCFYPVPSYGLSDDLSSSSNSISIIINWILLQGLVAKQKIMQDRVKTVKNPLYYSELSDYASQLKVSIAQLIEKNTGFFEFYSPIDDRPSGAGNFSVSAALYLDASFIQIKDPGSLSYWFYVGVIILITILLMKGVIFWIYRVQQEKKEESKTLIERGNNNHNDKDLNNQQEQQQQNNNIDNNNNNIEDAL